MSSTTNRRGWIVTGAVLLQLMLLIAAFSLGVYVERYGFTRDGLSYAVPIGRAPAGPGGPGNPGGVGAPGGPDNPPDNRPVGPGGPGQLPLGLEEPPQLIGRVQRIYPDALDLAAPEGPRQVLIDESTLYEDIDGARLSAADLRPEMILAIYGHFTTEGRNLLAARIVILPPPPQ